MYNTYLTIETSISSRLHILYNIALLQINAPTFSCCSVDWLRDLNF